MDKKKRPHNSTFAIGGVSCSEDSLVVKSPPIANLQTVMSKLLHEFNHRLGTVKIYEDKVECINNSGFLDFGKIITDCKMKLDLIVIRVYVLNPIILMN
jgi:hypothetical protein